MTVALRLTHFRFCPHSRATRLALAELGLEVALAEERAWEWRPAFLALNPAGELPLLHLETGAIVFGAYAISEYLADIYPHHPRDGLAVPLFPGSIEDRSEVRRLVDWFRAKLDREVTRELLAERILPRFQPGQPHTPDLDMMRVIRSNLKYHMSYIDYLAANRTWLAGDDMSYADLSAAAHLSCIDYIGEIDWSGTPAARRWYARLKSRPSMRGILADRVPGFGPPAHYADPDF